MSLEVKMTKIRIDGKYYEVEADKNLLETCLAIGLDIPHFCFHPALGSVGACRLCAVKKFKDIDDKKGRIVMSCMEPVTEGLIISIDDPDVKMFRASVIEGLMTNHPHDCPVCDEGGECHLQDMTVMTGHNYRRFDFKKRTYKNQDLGPFINHEMNRCIQCYRCVRFYNYYAGGKDLGVFGAHNHVYFGRQEEGTLESEFSGNLVEVCPTGVFTDKTLRKHFIRKWDLTNSPSICVHCSVGCNTIVSERYGSVQRIMNRYNGAVNGYFLCDRGRFGYEFVNDEERIRKAKIRITRNGNQEVITNELILSSLHKTLSKSKKIIGIGSPRASLESNYALSVLVGKENFYKGISAKEQLLTTTVLKFLQTSSVVSPSLKQIEKADLVIIIGEDLTNTAPMIALAVRQAIRNKPNEEAYEKGIPLWNDSPTRELGQDSKSPVYIITPFKDQLDDIAEISFRGSYFDISTFGSAIAFSLNEKAPPIKNKLKDQQELAERIALSLKKAKNPLIISGVSSGDEDILHAAMNIATALDPTNKKVMFCAVFPECNSLGLALMPGKSLEDSFSLAAEQEIDTLIVLENDLYRRANEESVNKLFSRSKQIIVLDHMVNRTSLKAHLLLPSTVFAESEGTLINNEGRAQRFYKSILNRDQVNESWKWIAELLKIKDSSQSVRWNRFDDISASLANELPVFIKLKDYKPDADFRMLNAKIPRQTIRFSGRTSIHSNISVSEAGVPDDPDSPLSFSMEGRNENPPSSLVPFYWAPGWNSVQAVNKYLDEPNGSLKGGDPGIRLIEPASESNNSWSEIHSGTDKIKKDEWLIIPVYQIFGSEELSSKGSAIRQRIKEPFVYLNTLDSELIGVKEKDFFQLEILDFKLKAEVKIDNSIKQGIAGLSVNLPDMKFIDLPCSGKFYKT
ncbi:MAG TPA: NADH-quinone oxidoreductase subunit NuoG [Bacteroidales bacterium]